MDSDLLLPIFWTFIFGTLLVLGVNRITKKLLTTKKCVRPAEDTKDTKDTKDN